MTSFHASSHTQAPTMIDRDTSTEQKLSVHIERAFAGFHLDVNFTVSSGLTVFFGPSGSGKSLTLQALAGLLPLDKANITLGDTVWQDSHTGQMISPQQRRVGYVPQNYALFPHLTIVQNIAFGMNRGKRDKAQGARVAELVSLMQLDGLEQRRPAQLSGGQQQRVALARALAVNPRLLLLDEPFSALDAAVRESLREELRAFYERVKIPTILVTHDVQEVQQLADTVVVIQQGRVLQVGTQREVFRFPRTSTVATLTGMRPCLDGAVQSVQTASQGNEHTEVHMATIRAGELTVLAQIPEGQHVEQGQHVEFALRSDEIELVSQEGTRQDMSGQDCVYVSGIVIHDYYRNPLHFVTVQLASNIRIDIPLLHRSWQQHPYNLGTSVKVRIPASAVYVFPTPSQA